MEIKEAKQVIEKLRKEKKWMMNKLSKHLYVCI